MTLVSITGFAGVLEDTYGERKSENHWRFTCPTSVLVMRRKVQHCMRFVTYQWAQGVGCKLLVTVRAKHRAYAVFAHV